MMALDSWGCILALPLTSCVILGTFTFLALVFSLITRDESIIYLLGLS